MGKLTEAQADHLWDLIDSFSNRIEPKYRVGAAEHGGNLWQMPPMKLLGEAINETVDQYTYLDTLHSVLTTLFNDPIIKKRIKELSKTPEPPGSDLWPEKK